MNQEGRTLSDCIYDIGNEAMHGRGLSIGYVIVAAITAAMVTVLALGTLCAISYAIWTDTIGRTDVKLACVLCISLVFVILAILVCRSALRLD
jgi:hypothetical protein